jgi:RNA polymerase sigma factor (sigma-70 family)
MTESLDTVFVQLVNENIGIAHKISRVYFEDHDDRKDLLQEMMFQLWRSYGEFAGRSKFSTWMYRVCLNTALTFRKKRKLQTQSIDQLDLDVADQSENEREHDVNDLLKAISTLSPINKAIILLYLDEMSYEEIAEVMGLTKSNVSVRLFRIKKELEAILKKETTRYGNA